MRVYLDHAATSPVLTEVEAAMVRWIRCGNPSSLYEEGRSAKAAIDQAREYVSEALGCGFAELLFTSSGTESASMAIIGAALAGDPSRRPTVLFSAAEHHCVLHVQSFVERLGYRVFLVPVDRFARTNVEVLAELLAKEDVLLFAGMHANNELGTLNPTREIASLCQRVGTLFFCDAVQTFGKVSFSVNDLGADLISLSAHKFGGPKGAGAIYIRAGTPMKPFLHGGGQEREMRAGTENVAAIVGMGEASRIALLPQTRKLEPSLSELLSARLLELGGVPTVANEIERLHSHVHIRFPGVSAETCLIALDRLGVSAGSGAACSSGSVEPSHVLLACGYSESQANEGIRFTLGPSTTTEEIELALGRISRVLDNLSQNAAAGTCETLPA